MQHGFGWVDADAVYRALCTPDSPLLAELQGAFGDILTTDGALDRPALASIVFSDAEKLKELNCITRSHIWAESQRKFQDLEQQGIQKVLFDAPTLFQVGLETHCHAIIGVIASRDVRIARIMARDGLTEQAAAARVDAQPDSDFYRTRCQFILENNEDSQSLLAQVNLLCQKLK